MIKSDILRHKKNINENVYVTLVGIDFTLRDFINLRCPNFVAAKRLEKNLKKIKIKTPSDLYKIDPQSLFNVRGLGVSQVFVAACVLSFCKFNPDIWFNRSLKKKRNHEI